MTDNQMPVKMDVDVKEKMEKFLETKTAKDFGFKSKADFVNEAVKLLLEKHESKIKHFNFHDNIIRLTDGNMPQYQDLVEIRLRGKTLHCTQCDVKDCRHIDASWNDEFIRDKLVKKGLSL